MLCLSPMSLTMSPTIHPSPHLFHRHWLDCYSSNLRLSSYTPLLVREGFLSGWDALPPYNCMINSLMSSRSLLHYPLISEFFLSILFKIAIPFHILNLISFTLLHYFSMTFIFSNWSTFNDCQAWVKGTNGDPHTVNINI